MISIHAPREGSDRGSFLRWSPCGYFYPRSPRGERRLALGVSTVLSSFLSTLPARGATNLPQRPGEIRRDFYPRSPRGERRGSLIMCACDTVFLSTLPARGATSSFTRRRTVDCEFLSTLPARGATRAPAWWPLSTKFLSTLPARGATAFWRPAPASRQFLSTLPARGATGPSLNA